jgi:hypothetical protein
MGWQANFDEPIPLAKGERLATLHDAAHYITKLPKAEHDAPEWQATRLFLEYDSRFEFEAETAAGIFRPMEAARHASGRARI